MAEHEMIYWIKPLRFEGLFVKTAKHNHNKSKDNSQNIEYMLIF